MLCITTNIIAKLFEFAKSFSTLIDIFRETQLKGC